VGENPESNVANIVVALDLGVEDYREVLQPEYKDKNFYIDLGVLRGCLCFLANFLGERVDVWMMKEYGVKESWTKLFSVAQYEVTGFLRSLKPLAYSKSGDEVLIEHDNLDLCWYDLKRKQVKNRIPGIPYSFEADTFVESLISVSPNRHLDGRTQDDDEDSKDRNKRYAVLNFMLPFFMSIFSSLDVTCYFGLVFVIRDDFLSEGFKLVL
jgi:hypothetical protein